MAKLIAIQLKTAVRAINSASAKLNTLLLVA